MALICDGCNVRTPWEHKCHEDRMQVRGEHVHGRCACPDCAPEISEEEAALWKAHRKIDAISAFRKRVDFGLSDTKRLFERVYGDGIGEPFIGEHSSSNSTEGK